MKLDKLYLPYYVEFTDQNGKKHYSVHQYRKTDGWVWSMRDYKFERLKPRPTESKLKASM